MEWSMGELRTRKSKRAHVHYVYEYCMYPLANIGSWIIIRCSTHLRYLAINMVHFEYQHCKCIPCFRLAEFLSTKRVQVSSRCITIFVLITPIDKTDIGFKSVYHQFCLNYNLTGQETLIALFECHIWGDLTTWRVYDGYSRSKYSHCMSDYPQCVLYTH